MASDASKPEVQSSTSKTIKQAAKALSKEELASQVQDLQAKMDKLNPALAFVVDQTTGKALIQLTDRATKEVILQFPSEAALQITRALDRFQKGQLVSRTV
ncbi:flagellar protein FlaG [Rhodoferax lacus]|nr:flagellar protein FlaG [Rhodoferax lacus]